jgi:hypothetical protein
MNILIRTATITVFLVAVSALTGCFGAQRGTFGLGLVGGPHEFTMGKHFGDPKIEASNNAYGPRLRYSSYMEDSDFGGEARLLMLIGGERTVYIDGAPDLKAGVDRMDIFAGWLYFVPDVEFGELEVFCGFRSATWSMWPLAGSLTEFYYYVTGFGFGARTRIYFDSDAEAEDDAPAEDEHNNWTTGWFFLGEVNFILPFDSYLDYIESGISMESDQVSTFPIQVQAGIYEQCENMKYGAALSYVSAVFGRADFPDGTSSFPSAQFTSIELLLEIIFDF